MEQSLEVLIDRLKSFKGKSTPVRRKILEILVTRLEPIAADELLAMIQKERASLNKSTIYRQLNFLIESGFVSEVFLSQTKTYYELHGETHGHHIVCTNCGKIERIEMKGDLSKIEKAIKEDNGFQVTEHLLEFFGVCKNCC